MNLQTLESVLAKDTFSDEELLAFLSLTDAECCSRLWREAYDRTTRVHGNALWFRGLIEISNYCIYDCRYCGIRKGNRLAQRYTLTPEEIVEAARYAVRAGYGSVALQAGERTDEKFIAFVEDVLRRIHRMSVGRKRQATVRLCAICFASKQAISSSLTICTRAKAVPKKHGPLDLKRWRRFASSAIKSARA